MGPPGHSHAKPLSAASPWLCSSQCGALVLVILATLVFPQTTNAFPPAPHHLIYGTVRDEYGTPLMTDQALLLLQTPSGVQLMTTVVPGLGFDMNFQLEVPMDAGLTPDPYEPKALIAGSAFKIFVVIGVTTNLPIQMAGNFSQLGQPGQQTRIDLTLGVDSNGDGIPDAWELAFLASIGSNLSLANLNPNLRLAGDGMTLRQEFLAGNYPFDPQEPFSLTLVAPNSGSPMIQFTAMTGRYYTLLGSPDLRTWTPLNFQVPAEGTAAPVHGYYFSPSIQTIQIQTIQPATGPTMRFFRMLLQ